MSRKIYLFLLPKKTLKKKIQKSTIETVVNVSWVHFKLYLVLPGKAQS